MGRPTFFSCAYSAQLFVVVEHYSPWPCVTTNQRHSKLMKGSIRKTGTATTLLESVEVEQSVTLDSQFLYTGTKKLIITSSFSFGVYLFPFKPCLDGILSLSVSNLRGDYHNPLPAKLVHTRKINLRRLVICCKTRW